MQLQAQSCAIHDQHHTHIYLACSPLELEDPISTGHALDSKVLERDSQDAVLRLCIHTRLQRPLDAQHLDASELRCAAEVDVSIDECTESERALEEHKHTS